jgi:hypothetical protein
MLRLCERMRIRHSSVELERRTHPHTHLKVGTVLAERERKNKLLSQQRESKIG